MRSASSAHTTSVWPRVPHYLLAHGPGQAAKAYLAAFDAFLEFLVGWDARAHKAYKGKGVFGDVNAVMCATEEQARKHLHCHALLFSLRVTSSLGRALDGDADAGQALAAYIDSFLTAAFVTFDPDMECDPELYQHNDAYIEHVDVPAHLYCNTRHPVAVPAILKCTRCGGKPFGVLAANTAALRYRFRKLGGTVYKPLPGDPDDAAPRPNDVFPVTANHLQAFVFANVRPQAHRDQLHVLVRSNTELRRRLVDMATVLSTPAAAPDNVRAIEDATTILTSDVMTYGGSSWNELRRLKELNAKRRRSHKRPRAHGSSSADSSRFRY